MKSEVRDDVQEVLILLLIMGFMVMFFAMVVFSLYGFCKFMGWW